MPEFPEEATPAFDLSKVTPFYHREDFALFSVPARVVEINPDGRVFHGLLCADPQRPEWPTASFTYYGGGGASGEYMVSPFAGEPGRSTMAKSLFAAVEAAVGWVRDAAASDGQAAA